MWSIPFIPYLPYNNGLFTLSTIKMTVHCTYSYSTLLLLNHIVIVLGTFVQVLISKSNVYIGACGPRNCGVFVEDSFDIRGVHRLFKKKEEPS